MEEPVCRICRCEGTPDAPLFHPCKCRGSIKYIHQDCLLSWLEHSHKDSCDICHTPYNFQTVYDPNMPDILPVSLILKKLFVKLGVFLYHAYMVILVLTVLVFQVPVFVSIVDRMLDWQIGCPVPYNNVQHGVLFGDEVTGKTLDDLGTVWNRLGMLFDNTWLRGLSIIAKYAFVLGSMVLIQGSILGDEGFTKIINKRIGPEPRINQLFEILHRRQLRRLRDRERGRMDLPDGDDDLNRVNLDDLQELVMHANRILDQRDQNAEAAQPAEQVDVAAEQVDDAAAEQANADDDEPQEPVEPEEPAEPAPLEVDPQLLARERELDEQEDLLEENVFLNTDKGPAFIFQMAIFMDVAAIGVPVCLKTLPTLISMVTVSIVDSFVKTIHHIAMSSTSFVWLNNLVVNSVELPPSALLTKIIQTYTNCINWTPQNDLFERRSVLILGFAILGLVIFGIMHRMEQGCSQNNPLTGGYRSTYIVLLELVCVLKVFVLVMTEWLVFPLFCGFQLEFALVAFFNEDLPAFMIDPPLLGTLGDWGVVSQWFLGTFFMYFFATFVNMIRSGILRRGVLFFIRPSDDPNLRLVHDALMRPFALKLTHIALSAIVYSLYILLEFTAVAWAVRLLSPVAILPASARFWNFERLLYLPLFFVSDATQNLVKESWKWIFRFSCAKLRLSSFMLDQDRPSERGRIVYRSLLARFSGQPTSAEPVPDADIFFKEHPEASSCFVPDGSYVRAPDDDQVSRKYVKQLFVPVTRDDLLLADIPEVEDDDEKFNPYGDEEQMTVTTYTVVYRPPKFRDRIFALFGMMWIFSMLMVFGFYLISVLCAHFLNVVLGVKHLNPAWSESIFKIDVFRAACAVTIGCNLPTVWQILLSQRNAMNESLEDNEGLLHFLSVPIRSAMDYVRSKREQIRFVFVIVSYVVAEVIVFVFAIILPGRAAENVISSPYLQYFRVLFGSLIFSSLIYMGGIVSSVDPQFTVTFKIRYKVFWVSLAIWLILFLELAGLILLHSPEDSALWPVRASGDLYALFSHWGSRETTRLSVWNVSRAASWIVFLVEELAVKGLNYFSTVNAELKEEYYSSGKVLANAPEE